MFKTITELVDECVDLLKSEEEYLQLKNNNEVGLETDDIKVMLEWKLDELCVNEVLQKSPSDLALGISKYKKTYVFCFS